MVHCFQYRERVRKYNKFTEASQMLMKSKARSTALASAVKIDESSGIRCILLWLSDTTSQPTFESYKLADNSYNEFAAL